MQSLLFALQAVAPIVGMIALGYVLKKLQFLDGEMAKRINRLVFRLFLPPYIPYCNGCPIWQRRWRC